MSIQKFRYLFYQFVNKRATPKEREEFLLMVDTDDFTDELHSLLSELWDEPLVAADLNKASSERIVAQILASPPASRRGGRGLWLRAAAVIVFGITCGLLYNSYWARIKPAPVAPAAPASSRQDKTPIRLSNLPDGSMIVLNENSKLTLGDQFMKNGKREVYLDGEAFFDVVHDSKQPFIVHTGQLKTTVLGTAFNINSDAENGRVTVTVTRGKVKVGNERETFNIIDPNEQVIYKSDHRTYLKKAVNADKAIRWRSEDIYFDDVSLKDMARQLEWKFNISIAFSDERLKKCRFSAIFLKHQNLEEILEVITQFNHMNFRYKDQRTVLLSGEGCS